MSNNAAGLFGPVFAGGEFFSVLHVTLFGALGTFLQSAYGEQDVDKVLNTFANNSSNAGNNEALSDWASSEVMRGDRLNSQDQLSGAGGLFDDSTSGSTGPLAFVKAYENIRGSKADASGVFSNEKKNRMRTQSEQLARR